MTPVCRAIRILSPVSYLRPPASCLLPPASCLLPPASYLLYYPVSFFIAYPASRHPHVAETANPFLDAGPPPPFDVIRPEHVEPGMRALLADLHARLDALEQAPEPTWSGLVEPIERMADDLFYRWGIVRHLMAVRNSDALRTAHEAVQPEVVRFGIRLEQSRPLYVALCALRDGADWPGLDSAQQRIVHLLIRDATLAGVRLGRAARERFNGIETELAELSTRFSNHVLDATKAFTLMLRERRDVDGLPASAVQLAAQAARAAGEPEANADTGPWCITLDAPSYVGFMQHSRRGDLRERLYRAYHARAAGGEFDNTPLLRRTLRLRREHAGLLGFATYADLSLATKMAPDVAAVEKLLEELRRVSFGAAQHDLEELREFARAHPELEATADDHEPALLQHWDVPFWAERLRERRYAYTDEELRSYFPLPAVLDGLFALAHRLFGVTIEAAGRDVPVWHDDVRVFRVRGEDGEPQAAFYLDPYSRMAEKRGGAWMDVCVGRTRLFPTASGGARLPVAYLVCNQSPPVDGRPSMMTFREVETLFHEFGHGLQHMLTCVDYGLAAGIRNIEGDAIELPSQFMENWCYHRETLLEMSRHHETGEPLPAALYDKICAARTFRAGSHMLRQLSVGFTDMALHHGYDPDGERSPFDVQRELADTTSVLPPLPDDGFLCSFTHIFAGGYAAGYYAYKWAEVLSADAFSAFEEAGLDDRNAVAEVGRGFRNTVLALGGSRPAMEIFVAFRGREPDIAALLRHADLGGETSPKRSA